MAKYTSSHTGAQIDAAIDSWNAYPADRVVGFVDSYPAETINYAIAHEPISVSQSPPSGVSVSRIYAHRDGHTIIINALLNVTQTYSGTNTVFNIPSPFRPTQNIDFDYGGDGGCGRGYIEPSGDIKMTLGVSGRVAFAACYCID